MALTNPQYDAIMRMYNERQLRHQREQQEHIRIAYEKIPRLAEIDAEIASLSVRKAKAMLNGDASMDLDLNAAIRDRSQERAALLSMHGYPADYLELTYDCPLCRDTGYINGTQKCACFKKAAVENAFWNAGFIGKFFCDILSADADIRAAHVVGKIFDQLFDLGNRNARHHVVSLGTVTLRNNADDFAVKIYQNAAAVRAAEDVGGQQIVLIVQRGNLVRNRSHHTVRNRIAVADRASDSHDRVTLADEIRTAERRNRKTVPCFLIQLRFIHLHNRKAPRSL